MRSILIVVFFVMIGVLKVYSQKLFTVDYASDSDFKVIVVEHASQADIKVYLEEVVSQVQGNRGIWHFTNIRSDADKKVLFVKYQSQADLKIYFVEYRSQAGWINENKKHLLND